MLIDQNSHSIISEPIIVKVNIGVTSLERQRSKRFICQELRRSHQLTLTSNNDNLVLSKSQVNIPLQAMVEALRACGHKECQVGFYGMKWTYPKAQPKIDRCLQLHVSLYGTITIHWHHSMSQSSGHLPLQPKSNLPPSNIHIRERCTTCSTS